MLLIALLPIVAGCSFERRNAESEDASGSSDVDDTLDDPADSAPRLVVESFREAVAAGDLSIALSMLDAEAAMVDPLAGGGSGTVGREEFLVALRDRHLEGITYEPVETEIVMAGDEAAVIVTVLEVIGPIDDSTSMDTRSLLESAFLIGSEEGWRIRHLHRSFVPQR